MFTFDALFASPPRKPASSSLAPQAPEQRPTKRYSVRGLALLAMSLGVVASAQIPSVADVTTPPVPGVGHNYIQENIETVNPANGSLSIRIVGGDNAGELVSCHPISQGGSPSSEVAKEAFSEVNKLEIGKSDYTSATETAKELGAQSMKGCAPTSCKWNLQIVSPRDPRGTVNSQVRFLATFSVEKGRVSKKAFALQIGAGVGVSFVKVSEENDFGRPTGELFKISKQSSNLTPFYRAFIWMSPTLDNAKRERLERFNFDCLDAPEACTDAKSLLPTIDWP